MDLNKDKDSSQDKVPKEYKDSLGLSKNELDRRLDLYTQLSTTKEAAFKQLQLKKDLTEQVKKDSQNRAISNIHYAQGARYGLPQAPPESINHGHEHLDQQKRDEVAQKAKSAYDQTSSLRKTFEESRGEEGAKKDLSKSFNKDDQDRDER